MSNSDLHLRANKIGSHGLASRPTTMSHAYATHPDGQHRVHNSHHVDQKHKVIVRQSPQNNDYLVARNSNNRQRFSG